MVGIIGIVMIITTFAVLSYLYYFHKRRWQFHILPYISLAISLYFLFLDIGKVDVMVIIFFIILIMAMHALIIYETFFKK